MNSKLFTHIPSPVRALAGRFLSRRVLDCGACSLVSRQKRHYYGILACAVTVMALSGLLLASHMRNTTPFPGASGPFGPLAQLPASAALMTEASFPLGPDTLFPLAFAPHNETEADCFAVAAFSEGASVRAPASGEILSCSLPQSFFTASGNKAGARKKQGPVVFDRGRVSVVTADGPVMLAELRRSPLPYAPDTDIFQADLFAPAVMRQGTPPLLFGERTGEDGLPLRWTDAGSDLRVCAAPKYNDADVIRRLIHGLGVLSADANYTAKAGRYRDFVKRYAEKYNLASALVLAIMHTESNFNPFAVSSQSAVGLMQIVPDTAGNEVYRFLMGTHGSPSIETLFTPEHNIRYGAAYLHLLGRRYFGRVANPSSRQMCMIAAYNGGPGAVLRVFAADQNEAFEKINALTPSEVYTTLTTQMPSEETRRYVELVLARIRDYSAH